MNSPESKPAARIIVTRSPVRADGSDSPLRAKEERDAIARAQEETRDYLKGLTGKARRVEAYRIGMKGAYVDVRPLEEYIPPEDASVIIPSAPEFIAGQLIQIEPVSE